jgi:DHA1 family bicyclomycin/chloramphenicol resistance-like MFS transporter
MAVMTGLQESLSRARRQRHRVGQVLATYARLVTDRAFIAQVLVGSLIFAGLLAYISGSPFVFIELFHVRPEHFGYYFGVNAIGIMTASQLNRWLAHRTDAALILRRVLPVSLVTSLALVANAWSGFGGFAGILVPLFFYIATHGFVMPNTTALAMAPHGSVAGSASALLGSIQFVLGALAGAIVSAASNGTAVPLAAVVAGCGISAFTIHAFSQLSFVSSPAAGRRSTASE